MENVVSTQMSLGRMDCFCLDLNLPCILGASLEPSLKNVSCTHNNVQRALVFHSLDLFNGRVEGQIPILQEIPQCKSLPGLPLLVIPLSLCLR